MTDQEAINVMARAIVTSNRDDPHTSQRTMRDDHLVGTEIAEHHAKAALRGLTEAGFKIVKAG